MGDPINKDRVGERWDQQRIDALLGEIVLDKDLTVVSGGFAWHLISPPHIEFKTTHDHKDIDYLVRKEHAGSLIARLRRRGYQKVWTRFDGMNHNFSRYEKQVSQGAQTVKAQIDLFVESAPFITLDNGVRVVEPSHLLSFYGVKHSSTHCYAVRAARELLAKGISPVGRPELAPLVDQR